LCRVIYLSFGLFFSSSESRSKGHIFWDELRPPNNIRLPLVAGPPAGSQRILSAQLWGKKNGSVLSTLQGTKALTADVRKCSPLICAYIWYTVEDAHTQIVYIYIYIYMNNNHDSNDNSNKYIYIYISIWCLCTCTHTYNMYIDIFIYLYLFFYLFISAGCPQNTTVSCTGIILD